MKELLKRAAAILTSAVLMLSIVPVETTGAFSLPAYIDSVTTAESNALFSSGKCGENLTWELDEDGTLNISGTGDMDNFQYDVSNDIDTVPWSRYRERTRLRRRCVCTV